MQVADAGNDRSHWSAGRGVALKVLSSSPNRDSAPLILVSSPRLLGSMASENIGSGNRTIGSLPGLPEWTIFPDVQVFDLGQRADHARRHLGDLLVLGPADQIRHARREHPLRSSLIISGVSDLIDPLCRRSWNT